MVQKVRNLTNFCKNRSWSPFQTMERKEQELNWLAFNKKLNKFILHFKRFCEWKKLRTFEKLLREKVSFVQCDQESYSTVCLWSVDLIGSFLYYFLTMEMELSTVPDPFWDPFTEARNCSLDTLFWILLLASTCTLLNKFDLYSKSLLQGFQRNLF